eukprot:jgi/Bigna1/77919/fgenesh1_pg.51_\
MKYLSRSRSVHPTYWPLKIASFAALESAADSSLLAVSLLRTTKFLKEIVVEKDWNNQRTGTNPLSNARQPWEWHVVLSAMNPPQPALWARPKIPTKKAKRAIPVDNPFQNQAMIRAFEVRGAGSSVVNGVYQADQQVDGVQAYRKVGTNIMLHRYPNTERRGTSIWWIADWGPGRRPADGDDTDYYFASSSLGLPPQSGWRIDSKCDGGLPAPVVAPHGVSVQYYQQQIHHQQQQQLTHSRGGAPIQLIRSLPESKYHCRKQSVATSPSSETPKKAMPSVEGVEKENGVDEVKASEPPSKEKNGFCRTTNETCCICLESFKEGESIIRLPCFHIFHSAEISKWLLKNHRCPLCQTSILRGFMEIDEKAS